jgi:hypothetical protein
MKRFFDHGCKYPHELKWDDQMMFSAFQPRERYLRASLAIYLPLYVQCDTMHIQNCEGKRCNKSSGEVLPSQ